MMTHWIALSHVCLVLFIIMPSDQFYILLCVRKKNEDTTWIIRGIRRRSANALTKRKRTNRQTMICRILSNPWMRKWPDCVYDKRDIFVVIYVVLADNCLSFYDFSFGQCIVYPSSIYGFWLHPSVSSQFLKLFIDCI